MTDQERHIVQLEEEFPSLSGNAFSAAFKQAREAGETVLVADKDVLYEVAPNGTRKRMKDIPPATPVPPGYTLIVP